MRRGVLLLLALLSLANAGDPPPLRVTVTPAIAQAPASLHLKLVIERHPDNRLVRIEIDGDHYFQAGDRQVDGEAGQRVWDEWWHDVPCGRYTVLVVLLRANGRTYQARGSSRVLGFACPTEEGP